MVEMLGSVSFDDSWMDIASVPRDGRLVWVGDPKAGRFVMRWNPRGSNSIFQPDPAGIWEASDESMTWSEFGGFGPRFWRPFDTALSQPNEEGEGK